MKDPDMGVPHLFRCPISLDLFTDPVTLCTGQTYDRSSIEKWLAAGNLTCPVTMQRLHDPSVVPNHTLRHLIERWLRLGREAGPDHFETIDPDRCLIALRHGLEAPESTLVDKVHMVGRVQVLSAESPLKCAAFLRLGFLPMLLELIFGNEDSRASSTPSPDQVHFVDQALSCTLQLLDFGELQCLNMLKEQSKLASFLALFEHGTVTIKISLCRLLETMSSSFETKELFTTLGHRLRLLRGMILLLHQNPEVSVVAIKAVSSLCSLESIREILLREGLIDGLLAYISRAKTQERAPAAPAAPSAMQLLEQLLGIEKAKKAILDDPQGITSALVETLFRVSDHGGSESAVNSLILLCCDSSEAREAALKAGVLTQLLLLLQSQCGDTTKTKARMLLKLLRSSKPYNMQ
ncbi:U-box domain-containing protein 26-like [Rhodamnia argentea]|uniref:U-box domain-containing protein n=1 Tax=Rhodamnia argentea TaxID=178133 RepID=A0ABM3GV07_9MYRT|nr:U-box domain-containing protein 26-like [Rhodamnia argentea]